MRTTLALLLALVFALSATSPGFAASQPPGSPSVEMSRPASQPSSNAKLDLNSANADDLATLKGIGPSKAKAIVEYRSQHGNFSSVDDLLNVRGIGQKTLDRLRDSITVGTK